ncbi:hypothetical protein CDAR_425501 [Caerostris darwini]|uniref:Uncharacterized protein n=1 Tax=Caerostris darwini TaxID=1538125 RepID=A0AAV4VK05_9ARAC|nr:hypothetical protein CDAR_425501 [Caerostris darwini]
MTGIRKRKVQLEKFRKHNFLERFKKRISFGGGDLGLFIEISRNSFSQIVNSRVRNGHHLLLLQMMATTRRRKSRGCIGIF